MNEHRPEDLEAVRRLLAYIGEDPDREGLLDTPKRFLKAWEEYTRGYKEKPEDILKVFEDGAQKVDEMVIVRTEESHAVPQLGATIHVTPRQDRLHLFDASTGKRL